MSEKKRPYDLLPYPKFIEGTTSYLIEGQAHLTEAEHAQVCDDLNAGSMESYRRGIRKITERYGSVPWSQIE
jgi:hypothetical protein